MPIPAHSSKIELLPEELLRLAELYRRYEQQRPPRTPQRPRDAFLDELERRNPYFSRYNYTSE